MALNKKLTKNIISNKHSNAILSKNFSKLAKTKEPVREGIVALMEPFIDTIVICSMTGLMIISTGVLDATDLTGAQLTRAAFEEGFSFYPILGSTIINISVLLFAYTTMVAWSYYGDRSIEYLVGEKAIKPYRYVYVFFNFIFYIT